MSLLISIFVVLVIFAVFSTQARAGYLDPGAGSTFFQWIAAAFGAFERWRRKLTEMLRGRQ